jgi:hypothetical protein
MLQLLHLLQGEGGREEGKEKWFRVPVTGYGKCNR